MITETPHKPILCLLLTLCILALMPGCAMMFGDKSHKMSEEALKKEVAKKWKKPEFTTVSTWVNYSPELDTKSRVDFARGNLEITAVVPKDSRNVKQTGEQKIAEQAKTIFSSENKAHMEALEGQVKNKNGELISKANLNQFIKIELIPGIRVEKNAYLDKEGIERVEMKVSIRMVPNHLRVRAKKYLSAIQQYAKKYRVAPATILAIIHTESFFNPFAKSSSGAVGLMQLIPDQGGLDAYQYVYQNQEMPPDDYFYQPENNIKLGTAYFHLLKNRYFKKITDVEKNLYLTICAYNWGPTAMKKYLIDRHDIDGMSAEELYGLLMRKTPSQTRKYLRWVVERSRMYARYFSGIVSPEYLVSN